MDEEKIEFLDLRRSKKTLEKNLEPFNQKKEDAKIPNQVLENATNPIIKGAFMKFIQTKKFDIEDL